MSAVIDFHSHVLPGIDDGSPSVEASVEMLRMEAEQGIRHVVATPHFYPRHDTPEHFLRRRAEAEPSAAVKERVDRARAIQNARYGTDSGICNARMRPGQLRKYCELDEASAALMKQAFEAMGLTARSYDRILKVARTVADLDGCEEIEALTVVDLLRREGIEKLKNAI